MLFGFRFCTLVFASALVSCGTESKSHSMNYESSSVDSQSGRLVLDKGLSSPAFTKGDFFFEIGANGDFSLQGNYAVSLVIISEEGDVDIQAQNDPDQVQSSNFKTPGKTITFEDGDAAISFRMRTIEPDYTVADLVDFSEIGVPLSGEVVFNTQDDIVDIDQISLSILGQKAILTKR